MELNKDRVRFALTLATILRRGDPVVYFDECSLNAWTKRKRVWAPKDYPMELALHWKRFKGVTLYGCIGHTIKGKAFLQTHKSTNKIDF